MAMSRATASDFESTADVVHIRTHFASDTYGDYSNSDGDVQARTLNVTGDTESDQPPAQLNIQAAPETSADDTAVIQLGLRVKSSPKNQVFDVKPVPPTGPRELDVESKPQVNPISPLLTSPMLKNANHRPKINRRVSIGVLSIADYPELAYLNKKNNEKDSLVSDVQSTKKDTTTDVTVDPSSADAEAQRNTQSSQVIDPLASPNSSADAPTSPQSTQSTQPSQTSQPPPLPSRPTINPVFTGSNNTPGLGLTKLRKLISQKRIRFQDGRYDLDLSYVTPQIIAMGIPGQGLSSLFRNPISSVASMLQSYHPDRYMLINLTENKYASTVFNNQVIDIGWEDHHAPPFHMLAKVVIAAAQWIALRPGNVVAVHCKAGKGRTGTVISALLVYAGIFDDPDEAFAYSSYRRARSFLKGGVTIPSQKRSVHALCSVLRGASPIPRPMTLEKITFHGIPNKNQKAKMEAYVKILFENREVVKSSKGGIVKLDGSSTSSNSTKSAQNPQGYDAVHQPGFDSNDDKNQALTDDEDEDEDEVITASTTLSTGQMVFGKDYQFGTFPKAKPITSELILDVPICGDYLLKLKAKRAAVLKQLNILRINFDSTMLFPSMDDHNVEAQRLAEAEEHEVDLLVGAQIKSQIQKESDDKKYDDRDDSYPGRKVNNEEDIMSPSYVEAKPIALPSSAGQSALKYCIAYYRSDLDGAHKKKGFPDDFRLDMHFSEPVSPTLQPCDSLEYHGVVPFRPTSFWEIYTGPNGIKGTQMYQSVYEPLYKLKNEFQAKVQNNELSDSQVKNFNLRMNKEYLRCTNQLKSLYFKPEKILQNDPNHFGFEPNPLWAELFYQRLREEFSNVAQTAGLLPYDSDEADWMIHNIRISATTLRKFIPYTVQAGSYIHSNNTSSMYDQTCDEQQPLASMQAVQEDEEVKSSPIVELAV